MSKYPILFSEGSTEFWGHGEGVLSDAISCVVKNEINGAYDLEMVYPLCGANFSKIAGRSIIYAFAGPGEGRQPFRIHNIIERSSGKVSIYAHHLSYDLSGIPVSSIDAESSDDAFAQIAENSVPSNPFKFICQRSVEKAYYSLVPKSARSRILDKGESILATYGGEYLFDHFNVTYKDKLGIDKGYRIKYGVNLIDLSQESNFDELYTGIYPYYGSGENIMELPERTVNAEGQFGFSRIKVVNLSSEFSEEPDEDLLREHAQRYIIDKKIGVPKVSLDLSHVHLTRFGDFCTAPSPEDVELGDTVWVEYPKYNITVSARVNSYTYDSLGMRYTAISVGDPKTGFIKTLLQLKNKGDAAIEIKQDAEEAKIVAGSAGAVADIALQAANSKVSIEALKNGNALISGIVLPINGSLGILYGGWNATPQTGGDPSRVVTMQDLADLGIIQ